MYEKIVVEMGPSPLSKNHMKPTKCMKMSNECVDMPGTPGPCKTQPYCEPEKRPAPDCRAFPHLHSLFDKLEQTLVPCASPKICRSILITRCQRNIRNE